MPSVARAYGCRVCDGGHELVVFLATTRSRAVLRDLGEGAPIAVIFSRPKTHVSLQLKGERADVLPLTAADREIMRAYGIAFAAEICALGYPMEFAKRLMQPVDEPAVGVRFATTAVFEQTPGPRAGERLGATGS